MFLSRSGLDLSDIARLQQQHLDEAVRGGYDFDKHRIVTIIGHDNKYGERQHKRLKDPSELADHQHIVHDTRKRPSITFGVLPKAHDPGHDIDHDDPRALRHDDSRFVSRVTFRHHPNDEGVPDGPDRGMSGEMEPHADDDTSAPFVGVHTTADHQRKGWAGSLWKYAKHTLGKHTKIEPKHDWGNQTPDGAAWSRSLDPDDSPESSARREVHDPHGAAHDALNWHKSISGDKNKPLKWHQVHPDDRDHILDFADEHLDNNNGFWHAKHSHAALKKVMRRAGYPSPSSNFASTLFDSMGGRRK